MAILKYDSLECGFMCSECEARYSEEEIQRAFDYSNISPENFVAIHCMDCGVEFDACDLTEYNEED